MILSWLSRWQAGNLAGPTNNGGQRSSFSFGFWGVKGAISTSGGISLLPCALLPCPFSPPWFCCPVFLLGWRIWVHACRARILPPTLTWLVSHRPPRLMSDSGLCPLSRLGTSSAISVAPVVPGSFSTRSSGGISEDEISQAPVSRFEPGRGCTTGNRITRWAKKNKERMLI